MGSEWQTFSLADLYDFSSGLSKPRSAFGSGYPFLSFKDVFYNSAVPSQLHELVNSTERERARGSVKRGDVFLTRTSETMDELAMSSVALTDIPDATFNGFTKRLRPKHRRHVAPEFARYYFRSPTFRQDVYAMSSLSTRASLNNEMLERLVITLPSYEEQLDIGETLGALDDRIDLLRQTNTTLEAIAQALFKSWFVSFDPVHAKAEGREPEAMDAATAALFPGEFEESELGPVPKRWRAGCLGDVSSNSRDQAQPGKIDPDTPYFGLEHMPRKSIALGDHGTADGLGSGKFWFEESDILFGKLRPYFHKVGLAPFKGICSTDILVLRPLQPAFHAFLLLHASSDAFIDYASRLSNGAKMPRSSWKDIANYPICIPPDSAVQAFNEMVAPMLRRIKANVEAASTLAKLRDPLLPRLISGKLRLPKP